MIYIIGIIIITGVITGMLLIIKASYVREQREQDERMLILERRIENYNKELNWQIDMETKIRSDFENQVNSELLKIRKQVKKKKEV